MTSKFGETEAAFGLTALESLETTDENLPMPPSLVEEEDQNLHIIDRFRAINKDKTIHQLTNFSRREFFNIFTIVEDAILNRFLKERDRTFPIASADMLFILLAALICGTL